MDARVKGVVVGLAWFFVFGGIASMSSLFMLFMHSGGFSTPGPLFRYVLLASLFGTPPLVALAGIPLAHHIYHERPATKVGLTTLVATCFVFAMSWILPIAARVV